jgi:Na+-driven multidrug efflux pump
VNSALSIAALVLNVALNLVLIPQLGIVGAALASLVSYSFNAIALTLYSSRAAGNSLASFWVVRPRDVRFTVATSLSLLGRVRSSIRATAGGRT